MDYGDRLVFAVDPEFPQITAIQTCQPGSSGSLLIDNHGNAAVVSAILDFTGFSPSDKNSRIRQEEVAYGLDLHGVSALCFATPLYASTFKAFADALR